VVPAEIIPVCEEDMPEFAEGPGFEPMALVAGTGRRSDIPTATQYNGVQAGAALYQHMHFNFFYDLDRINTSLVKLKQILLIETTVS